MNSHLVCAIQLKVSQSKELFKFILVGVSSSISYLIILSVLSVLFNWGSTPSIVVAYLFGTLVSYVGTVIFAFRKNMTRSNLIRFLIIVGVSLFINVLISEVLSPMGVSTILIGFINVGVVGAFNFLSHKYWTFK